MNCRKIKIKVGGTVMPHSLKNTGLNPLVTQVLFCMKFSCCPHACMCFLQVLKLPPTVWSMVYRLIIIISNNQLLLYFSLHHSYQNLFLQYCVHSPDSVYECEGRPMFYFLTCQMSCILLLKIPNLNWLIALSYTGRPRKAHTPTFTLCAWATGVKVHCV